jgi:predicted aspartyl protease
MIFMSPQLRGQVRFIANSYETTPPTAPVSIAQTAQVDHLPKIAHGHATAVVGSVGTILPDARRSVRVQEPKSNPALKEYARGLLRTKVYVYGTGLNAVIDWGSSVNVMPLKTAQALDLSLRKNPHLFMVPVDGRTRPFYGVAESLPVAIGDIAPRRIV